MGCCDGVKTMLAVFLQLMETGSLCTPPTSKPDGQALPSVGLSQHTWKHIFIPVSKEQRLINTSGCV